MMEEIQGINQQHTRILQEFIVFVQKQTYIITEGECEGKYQDFEEVMQDVFAYYVDFRKYAVKDEDGVEEWVYMLPNLLMYSFLGFLAGIKSKKNYRLVNKIEINVVQATMETIGLISDMYKNDWYVENNHKQKGLWHS